MRIWYDMIYVKPNPSLGLSAIYHRSYIVIYLAKHVCVWIYIYAHKGWYDGWYMIISLISLLPLIVNVCVWMHLYMSA